MKKIESSGRPLEVEATLGTVGIATSMKSTNAISRIVGAILLTLSNFISMQWWFSEGSSKRKISNESTTFLQSNNTPEIKCPETAISGVDSFSPKILHAGDPASLPRSPERSASLVEAPFETASGEFVTCHPETVSKTQKIKEFVKKYKYQITAATILSLLVVFMYRSSQTSVHKPSSIAPSFNKPPLPPSVSTSSMQSGPSITSSHSTPLSIAPSFNKPPLPPSVSTSSMQSGPSITSSHSTPLSIAPSFNKPPLPPSVSTSSMQSGPSITSSHSTPLSIAPSFNKPPLPPSVSTSSMQSGPSITSSHSTPLSIAPSFNKPPLPPSVSTSSMKPTSILSMPQSYVMEKPTVQPSVGGVKKAILNVGDNDITLCVYESDPTTKKLLNVLSEQHCIPPEDNAQSSSMDMFKAIRKILDTHHVEKVRAFADTKYGTTNNGTDWPQLINWFTGINFQPREII